MPKAIIVYESKYGNTRQAAGEIARGLEAAGTSVETVEFNNTDAARLAGYDAVVIGTPTHWGGPAGKARKFIENLGKNPAPGRVAVFDTYIKGDFEKSVKKMEERLREKAAGWQIIAPGLSIKVDGMKGPISEGELPKCLEFGQKLGSNLRG